MMQRSSRFISLSGLSGIFAGVYALIGAVLVFNHIYTVKGIGYQRTLLDFGRDDILFMIYVAIGVMVLAIATGIFFTTRKARQNGQSIWDTSSKRLLVNLLIPLMAGGVFCLILISWGLHGLVAPATLIFYGLALLNASHYTLRDIRYLGISEILLGLVASVYIGYGLIFWAIGFGVLHIIYGALMYYKYEK